MRAAYYYRTRWGTHDEFVDLFVRNHWPILRAQKETGRILDVTLEAPRFHGDGRADWDVLVTITWRDWAAIEEHSDPTIASRLFPDREAYAAEERRRFEPPRGALGRPARARRACRTPRGRGSGRTRTGPVAAMSGPTDADALALAEEAARRREPRRPPARKPGQARRDADAAARARRRAPG